MEQLARLIVDSADNGPWNMAVDEALLLEATERSCVLRFYRWTPPTLSLGYFQPYQERDTHLPSASCPVVRRPSGGGAIVHDRELTYCLVLGRQHPIASNTKELYLTVHRAIIEALANWSVKAEVWCSTSQHSEHAQTAGCDSLGSIANSPRVQSQPFLCFERRTFGDLVVGQTKIVGSAQRRKAAAVLQHGSILLGRSEAAPELPGIADVCHVEIDVAELIATITRSLGRRLGVQWEQGDLTATESHRAATLVFRKYGTSGWTIDRRSEV